MLDVDIASVWAWNGWTRLADFATIGTTLATAAIASLLLARSQGRLKLVERYLRDAARNKAPGEQGLRSAMRISRDLEIPVDEVNQLVFKSRKVVRRIRQKEGEEPRLVFGYKGLVK